MPGEGLRGALGETEPAVESASFRASSSNELVGVLFAGKLGGDGQPVEAR